ncbi:MAG TPA: thiamine pyrophosphate-dependent enzyme [Saprospiraceae bacterium]|nr:thiamine pyrophosphate-dependent enzyme [Saprospiraceae bacterium]
MIENAIVKEQSYSKVTKAILEDKAAVLKDFETCCISREASLLARKEVLTGKAKFGITGDGKEVPQVALAKAFKKGDFRSGYYRDQTLMFALDLCSIEDYFAQLYADTENDPFSKGRQMNNHFATALVDPTTGAFTEHTQQYNVISDVSNTAGQFPRALGLAEASKHYRASKTLKNKSQDLSIDGNEICFATVGDASTSEGIFWETINAAGVMQVPLFINVWDDGYGISVPKKYQTVKSSISKALKGMQSEDEEDNGIDIYYVKAGDYAGLIDTYLKAAQKARRSHRPVLFHVDDVTQPQGHSTSGSHERYKTKERLQWERENDCILLFEQWINEQGLASPEETAEIRREAKKAVKEGRNRAWKQYFAPVKNHLDRLKAIYKELPKYNEALQAIKNELEMLINPFLSEILQNAKRAKYATIGMEAETRAELLSWIKSIEVLGQERYHSKLYSDSKRSALRVPVVPVKYADQPEKKSGYEIINAYFDKKFAEDPRLVAFGEDVGHIGDVNQGFAGLQKKYGKHRIFDTGIREWSIMGQAIGLAARGLRPIAEIQYLDYLIYGLEPLSDDLATLRWRSAGQQAAPAIIRTRGHRLEGIWHAGSPLGMILNSLRGMYVLTPRDMVQAAGLYNTLLQSDDPALMIECLNGYRLKENVPENLGEYTVPLGVPEVLQKGTDLTLVTYGSCVRVAQQGMELLEKTGISVELIDVQTLLPFDLEHRIVASLKKTNRILFMDEDVPGGASAYMMQKVLEEQGGYRYLDSKPISLTAKDHRTPYGSDGDYFTKPNPEDVFEAVYQLIYEADPARFKGKL